MVKRSKSASRREEPDSHGSGTSPRSGLLQALVQRGVAKFGKRLPAFSVVERAVAVVRHGADTRRRLDGDLPPGEFGGQPGDLQERMDLAGSDVQRTNAAVLQRHENEFCDIVDKDMVALFLAFTEQHDV